jgi:hypothetical protein
MAAININNVALTADPYKLGLKLSYVNLAPNSYQRIIDHLLLSGWARAGNQEYYKVMPAHERQNGVDSAIANVVYIAGLVPTLPKNDPGGETPKLSSFNLVEYKVEVNTISHVLF